MTRRQGQSAPAMPKEQVDPREVELKFQVLPAARSAVAQAMARSSAALERTTLVAIYLDTPDRRLAQEGLSWRLRREGRRWVQTLKAPGATPVDRFEHEVIRPDATHDPDGHAGTIAGRRLLEVLEQASAVGLEAGCRFRTEFRRTSRRVRTRGAVVEVSFDEGKVLAGDAHQRLCELEFELLSGSTQALLDLAERWRRRFGLVYEPRSKAERGDALAAGDPWPPVRKALRPKYARTATVREALGAVAGECLGQIQANAIGLSEGFADRRVEHVHQLRVGVRRLRSAVRSFQGWAPAPPDQLVAGLKVLFAELGRSRDDDVLSSGVAAQLARAGAPGLDVPAGSRGGDPEAVIRSSDTQRVLLGWMAWRVALVDTTDDTHDAGPPTSKGVSTNGDDGGSTGEAAGPEAAEPALSPEADVRLLQTRVEKRLRRWHRRIAADWEVFETLEEPALHDLRKRIKRQRYAVEFFAPLLRRRSVDRYLKPLAAVQERLGTLNDLFVARARYQDLVQSRPEAWFALGWLTARIAAVREDVRSDLGDLVESLPPSR